MVEGSSAQPAQSAEAPSEARERRSHDQHGFRRKMIGAVVSARMQKTVVVEVVTHRRDPLYGKYVRARARYKAHDAKGELRVGDEVEIQEHRPISREKRWLVTRLVKKFVEE